MYKFIRIAYDSALDEYIEKLLEKSKVKKYVKIPEIMAKWSEEIKHMDTHVWPGMDSIVMVILETEEAKKLCDCLRKLKKETDINFFVTVMPVDEVIE